MDIQSYQSLQSKATQLETAMIDGLSQLPFASVLTDSKNDKNLDRSYIKVKNHYLKVDHVDRHLGQELQETHLRTELKSQTEQTTSQTVSSEGREKPLTQDQPQQDSSQGFHSGLTVFLRPLDHQPFLKELPQSLRDFIEETVRVVRVQTGVQKDTEYRFLFTKLGMEIMVQKLEDTLVIRLSMKDGDLKQDLFNEENMALIVKALQDEFPDEEIDFQFVQDEQASSDQPQKDQEKDQDAQDDETT